VACVIGALSVSGWRSRVLWAGALLFGVTTVTYLMAQQGAPFAMVVRTLWAMSPLICVVLVSLLTTQRQVISFPKRLPSGKPPVLNPALTADYLNSLLANVTTLEGARNIAGLKGQLAQLRGQVKDLTDGGGGAITAEIVGLHSRYGMYWHDTITVAFKASQTVALETIKHGDWIEFVGEVEPGGVVGWRMRRCELIGRAKPPSPPRRKAGQAKASSRSA